VGIVPTYGGTKRTRMWARVGDLAESFAGQGGWWSVIGDQRLNLTGQWSLPVVNGVFGRKV
jgi:hypothetical protein